MSIERDVTISAIRNIYYENGARPVRSVTLSYEIDGGDEALAYTMIVPFGTTDEEMIEIARHHMRKTCMHIISQSPQWDRSEDYLTNLNEKALAE